MKKKFMNDINLDVTYEEALANYDSLVSKCTNVSTSCAGIPSPTSQHYYASLLFTKLCTTSVSLLHLVPHNRLTINLIDHWDYSSIASLTRNLVDCYLAFFYLCIDAVDEKEWDCRWNLFNLHDCLARKKLFEGINDTNEAIKFEDQAKELNKRLLSNPHFLSLSLKKQKQFLKGKTAYLLSTVEIVSKYSGNVDEFRWFYHFLSSQVHSLPMSFYRMGEQGRGRGVYCKIESNYISLCLTYVTTYLEKACNEMERLFSGLTKEQ